MYFAPLAERWFVRRRRAYGECESDYCSNKEAQSFHRRLRFGLVDNDRCTAEAGWLQGELARMRRGGNGKMPESQAGQ